MARRARLLMIQGTSSGSGKSTLVTGLCRLFSDAGYKVAPYKAQNMSSNLYPTGDGCKMARAQAIQAVAARVQPSALMNPVLLKPLGDYRSEVLVNGRFYAEMHAKDYYEKFALKQGLPVALKALDSLRKEHDIVVMEGAGSPAEVNISKYDIANMLVAERAKAPVIIVADIERGGCFASIAGTMQLLKARHRALVKGFLINKFRGDQSLLEPGIKQIYGLTKKRVLGVIPKIDFDLPEEDSLTGGPGRPDLPQESWDWQIGLLAKAISESVDIPKLEKVAGL
ncbi:cobyric acid synthase [Nitrososphaera sp.]|uniref:cobyric acid synthase n=1 Tax=Nitrososphaera sp. TaxID=1971748 RepID=UPI00316FC075